MELSQTDIEIQVSAEYCYLLIFQWLCTVKMVFWLPYAEATEAISTQMAILKRRKELDA